MTDTMTQSERWALVGDEIKERSRAQIDIEDRGYQFGDGIYEVMRVYGGKLFQGRDHAARCARSLRELRIDFPDCEQRVIDGATRLVAAENIGDGIVYFQITRGVAPRTHQFPGPSVDPVLTGTASALPRPMANIEGGVSVLITEDIRWLRNDIKSLNLLGAVMAKQAAKDAGCFEAVLHRSELVTEGASSNIFIAKNGELVTHPTDNLILAGITRKTVVCLAREIGIHVQERAFSVEELMNADEAFMTSTTAEVTPIVRVLSGQTETRLSDGRKGSMAEALQKRFERLIVQ